MLRIPATLPRLSPGPKPCCNVKQAKNTGTSRLFTFNKQLFCTSLPSKEQSDLFTENSRCGDEEENVGEHIYHAGPVDGRVSDIVELCHHVGDDRVHDPLGTIRG